jgi:hypothetical protein
MAFWIGNEMRNGTPKFLIPAHYRRARSLRTVIAIGSEKKRKRIGEVPNCGEKERQRSIVL